MPEYLRYRDDLEAIEPDEPETFRKIIDVMTAGMHEVRRQADRSIRISHAKAHAFLKGEIVVTDGLPPELAQGLFARPRSYAALVRLSQVPGEVLDDRKVSSPRGMSIKVFGVEGPKLPGHEGATQDFLLDTGGTVFPFADAKQFLAGFAPNDVVAPLLPEAVKGVVSKVARAANVALHAVGLNSPLLDAYGHPPEHPLSQSYYSQAPLRYGDYVAKVGVVPATDALKAMQGQKLDLKDENGVRDAVIEFFRTNEARYDVRVQLAVDEKRTPIEDASVEWPEDVSPYRTVAQLVLPPQDAYDPARQEAVDVGMAFAPWHALAAHRPLGSLMRARLAVYPVLSARRHRENGAAVAEPASLDAVPG